MIEQSVGPRSVTLASRDGDLAVSVVRFCRLLRAWGVPLHGSGAQTALLTLREMDFRQRADIRTALQVALIHRPEDFALFTYLFNAFFRVGKSRHDAPANEGLSNRPVDARRLGRDVQDEESSERSAGRFKPVGPAATAGPRDETPERSEFTRAASSGAKREVAGEEPGAHRLELERLARALDDELATRPSRRFVRDSRGRQVDMRGMLRDSLRFGGVPVKLRRKSRRVARTRLVLLCDVSRSMDEHAAFLVEFAAAVLRRSLKVEVFLFASELVRVSDLWKGKSWNELQRAVPDCGGGTRIGACLDRFLHDYDASLLGRGAVVMVLSDGLDAGDPEQLGAALERIRRRAHKIIWLNPLLRLDGYEPRARGMAAALPHVDVFASAHDVGSLWELVRMIRNSSNGRSAGSALASAAA